MKPFPACYRAARYRAANCRRGFPSFLNGERRVAKRKAKGFSHERTNFIHSRWTVSWKDNRARTRASASSFADREPLIASSRSPKLLFARLFFSSPSSLHPFSNAWLQGLTRLGLAAPPRLPMVRRPPDFNVHSSVYIPSSRHLSSHLPEITLDAPTPSRSSRLEMRFWDAEGFKDRQRILLSVSFSIRFLTQFSFLRAVFRTSEYFPMESSGLLSLFSSNFK